MTILYFALFLLLVGLVLWACNGIVRKLSYRMGMRYLHCRLIPAVLIVLLAVTNVYTVSYLLDFLDTIVNSPILSSIFDAILPHRAYELVYMLLIIIGLNIIATLLTALTIALTKLIFIRSKDFIDIHDYVGISRLLHLPWLLAGKFYSEEEDEVSINHKGVTLGIWAKGLKYAFAILLAVELVGLGVSILWGSEDWNTMVLSISKNWYMIPMAGFLLVEQVQLFLEGEVEEEAGSFGTTDVGESMDSNISKLMDAYDTILQPSGALLCKDLTETRVTGPGLGGRDLGTRLVEDCRQPEVLNVIENQLRQCNADTNEQYRNALVELLNGNSVNMCYQCEGEFFIYLAAYLNFYISQGKTALILCKDQERAAELCKSMDAQMHRLNNLYSVWDVRTVEGAEINCRLSILVCSFDEFLERRICEKRRDFMSDLFCTVVMDGFDLFSRNHIRVERLFSALRGIDGMDQYVFFTGVDNDALRTAIEQAIKVDVKPFLNHKMQPNTGIMVWREESYYRLQRHLSIGGPLSPYMGTSLPLALVALKYDLPQVHIIRTASRGDRSFNDAMNMSSAEVTRFVDNTVNLKTALRYEIDELSTPQDLAMIVAYDTDYNFYNTLWRWMKYGGTKGALIHVVSPSYMLREFFVANFHDNKMLLKNNEYDALISYHLGMRISHMAVLMVSLSEGGMTEDELMAKNKEFGWKFENVEQLLEECLRVVLTREEVHSIYECFHFEEIKTFREDLGIFENHTRITLTDDTIRSRLQERIGHVTLVSKGDMRQTLPILRGNIHNYYQQGQITAINGHLYEIHSISDGCIYAEQRLPQDLPEYYHLSNFTFRDYHKVSECVDSAPIDFNICAASVTRESFGYWSCNRGNSFASNCDIQLHKFGKSQLTEFSCVNIMEMNIRRSELEGRDVETARLLAYMLKELFKTLFPTTHQNLYTMISEGGDDALIARILDKGKGSPLEDLVCSLVPQAKGAPATDPDFITVYVVELSCIEYGMVQMLYNRRRSVLLMIREYLDWYLRSSVEETAEMPMESLEDSREGGELMEGFDVGSAEAATIRPSYLHFGSDSVPSVLAPDVLLQLCRKILPEVDRVTETTSGPPRTEATPCTFCGRPTLFPTRLSDGRVMCSHCKDHQLTQRNEIKSMFVETQGALITDYGISLPRNIHVRFASATEILRATGGVDGGRILGFYNPGNHQLWLEARGPRVAMQSTLIHELTHAWQHHDRVFYQNLQKVLRKFPRKKRALVRLLLLEGHSVYMEIDAMRRCFHEDDYANRLALITAAREDEYGVGYRMVAGYLDSRRGEGSHITPFKAMNELLNAIIEGSVTIEV